MRARAAVAVLLLPLGAGAGAGAGACGAGGGDEQALTVLAAASLTEAFTELGDDFEKQHEGVEVRFSFGSSTTLAEQAVQGAPADVLATADATAMDIAEIGGVLVGEALEFATNAMVLVVPHGNPARVRGYADLARVDWVRCADDAPCGRAAASLLKANPTATGRPVSLEIDVKAVLAKVASGEAEAGFVYASDAKATPADVDVVDVPGAVPVVTSYFIAAVDQADGDRRLARGWIELVTSDPGSRALLEAGFGPPSDYSDHGQ